MPEPFDASDPKKVEAAKVKAGRIRKQDDEVLKGVLATPQGRAFLYRILSELHIFETAFLEGRPDATAFRLGEQNFGLRLIASITRVDTDAYVLMMKEAQTDE